MRVIGSRSVLRAWRVRAVGVTVASAAALGLTGCAMPGMASDRDALAPIREQPVAIGVTTTTTTAPFEEFVSETLGGQEYTIRSGEGPLYEFVDGIPAQIRNIDALAHDGDCDQIVAVRDFFARLVTDPVDGRTASVYANRADDVAAFIGCDR